jgi:beta-glucanase (GH16 family)
MIMKNIFKNLLAMFSIILIFGCQEVDQEFGDVIAPSNLTLDYEIVGVDADNPNGDGSGMVNFYASADNAITFRYNFGDNTAVKVAPSGDIAHGFFEPGLNSYVVTVIASGTGGVTTSTSITIDVFSAFNDVEAKSFLTGAPTTTDADGNLVLNLDQTYSKTWYWAADRPLHAGLGPVEDDYGSGEFAYEAWWNSIQPFDEAKECMYTNTFVFTINTDGVMTFEQRDGLAFSPGAYADTIGIAGETCHDETTIPSIAGIKGVSFLPSSSKAALEGGYNGQPYRGTSFQISDDGFLGWFVGSGLYDIIHIDNDLMRVRVIQDGGGFAWYQLLSSTDPFEAGSSNELETEYTNLVWSDEFDVDGAPNPANWTYDLEDGCQIDSNLCGWGNNEEQWYTSDSDNIVVEGGMLKITAIKEPTGTRDYSSARIKTQDLFEFTNGRVEIRAKLPASVGAWPALWMLGSNNDVVGWPESGEIDIMEYSPFLNPNQVVATAYWDNAGSLASHSENTIVDNLNSEFHNYTLEWREDQILIAVDNEVFYTLDYDSSLPFNQDFFILINLAMGGNFGGTIDSGFTQDTLEVDYVRVYQ